MRSSVDIRRMIFGVIVVCVFGAAVFGQPWTGSFLPFCVIGYLYRH